MEGQENRVVLALSKINAAQMSGKHKYTICQSGYYEDAMSFGVNFDEEMLQQLIRNYDKKTMSAGVFVYYGHWDSKREAAGEVVSLAMDYDMESGKYQLQADIKWNKDGMKKVKEKVYNFFSVEVATNYSTADLIKDANNDEVQKSRTYYGATLTGVALTNEPAVHDLPRMKLSQKNDLYGVYLQKDVAASAQSAENKREDKKSEDNMSDELKKLFGKLGVSDEKGIESKFLELSSGLEKAQAAMKKMEADAAQREKDLFEKERKAFSKSLFEGEKISKEVADAVDKIEDRKVFDSVKGILELSVKQNKVDNKLPSVKGRGGEPKDSEIAETKFEASDKANLTLEDFTKGVV